MGNIFKLQAQLETAPTMVVANFHPCLAVVVSMPAEGSSFRMLVEVMVDELRKIRDLNHRFQKTSPGVSASGTPSAIRLKDKFCDTCRRIVVSRTQKLSTSGVSRGSTPSRKQVHTWVTWCRKKSIHMLGGVIEFEFMPIRLQSG